MGNNQGKEKNPIKNHNKENQMRKDLSDCLIKKCEEVSSGNMITFDRYNDVMSVFEDFNLISLRKTPLSKKMFDKLDTNRSNKISVNILKDYLKKIIQMDRETAIQCLFKRFVYSDKWGQKLYQKRRFFEFHEPMLLLRLQNFIRLYE